MTALLLALLFALLLGLGACSPAARISSSATPTLGPGGRLIVIESPRPNAAISLASGGVAVSGRVTVSPFEATLTGRVYDARGAALGIGPIHVQAEAGQPGPFAGTIPLDAGASPGPARVEIAELSARDGSVIISASVPIRLAR